MAFKQDDQEKTIRHFRFSGMWGNSGKPLEKTLGLFHCVSLTKATERQIPHNGGGGGTILDIGGVKG